MKFNGSIIANAFGDLHIQNDAIALSEQIKNAVDANATYIKFDFSEMNENKLMMITDDGCGMSPQKFEDEWNAIGNSSKDDDINMLGGKGIGRFSLFRLSNNIKIYTKEKNNTPCYIDLDYEILLQQNDLNEFEFTVTKINDDNWKRLTNIESGTVIVLEKVKEINYNFIKRELENINLPFSKKRIEIEFIFPEDNIQEFYDCEQACIYAPFNITAEFKDGKFSKCICKIRDILGQVRIVDEMNTLSLDEEVNSSLCNEEEGYNIDENLLKELGEVKIYIDSFFFDNTYMKKASFKTTDIQHNFLSSYQGINIYRNSIKIFGFGRTDFLKLAEKRLKRAAENIDNKQTFGFVEIAPESKSKLLEQTNREGFIANDYSYALNIIIDKVVELIGKYRQTNKEKILTQDFDNKPKDFLKIKKVPKLDSTTRDKEIISAKIKDIVQKNLTTNIDLSELDIKIDTTKYDNTQLGVQFVPVEVSYRKDRSIKLNFSIETSLKRPVPKKDEALLYLNSKLMNDLKMKNEKLYTLLNEVVTLNVYQYPNACAYLLRSIIELSFNLYIVKNITSCSLKFEYDYVQEELFRTNKGKRNSVSAKDRIVTAMRVLKFTKAPVFLENKETILLEGIEKINYTVHKKNSFTIPGNLLSFYNEIHQILEYVLKEISK